MVKLKNTSVRINISKFWIEQIQLFKWTNPLFKWTNPKFQMIKSTRVIWIVFINWVCLFVPSKNVLVWHVTYISDILEWVGAYLILIYGFCNLNVFVFFYFIFCIIYFAFSIWCFALWFYISGKGFILMFREWLKKYLGGPSALGGRGQKWKIQW